MKLSLFNGREKMCRMQSELKCETIYFADTITLYKLLLITTQYWFRKLIISTKLSSDDIEWYRTQALDGATSSHTAVFGEPCMKMSLKLVFV